jgi:16S rRNA (uracil1498-N3)-methyltransferase
LAAAGLPPPGDVVLIVGPEGGLTEEELTVFGSAGGTVVRLGPQVLRTSTAGAVALGALGVLTGRWT